MLKRDIEMELFTLLGEYPIVTVLGPRQAGKTTLVRQALPEYEYVSLEDPDLREQAIEDPRQFLRNYSNRVIFDEVQRAPKILSYLQGIVDEKSQDYGQFVLTGSQQFDLKREIEQSLAGRTAILTMLPLSCSELKQGDKSILSFGETAYRGTMPRLFADEVRVSTYYANYLKTYVERDVSEFLNIRDHLLFRKFMKLLAGRVGQLVDFTSLANDTGVSRNTVSEWVSILEASFIIYRLPPYFENFGKRVIKSPKCYFLETGLLCYLLGIQNAQQVERDPLVGSIFENFVVTESLKGKANQGEDLNLYFFRDSNGNEIDMIDEYDRRLRGFEIKSSETYHKEFSKSLLRFEQSAQPFKKKYVIYSGESRTMANDIEAIHFAEVSELMSRN